MSILFSIVICSRSNEISVNQQENITSTWGLSEEEGEIVVIDNTDNKYSICQAYNEGVRRSSGAILCFIHEDVRFRTSGWAKVLSDILEDESIGLLGVAGSHIFPKTPCAWWEGGAISEQLIQGYKENGKYKTKPICFDKYRGITNELVAVDGLFMCMPRKVFEKVSWDSKTFTGFHAYDMDMSFQIVQAGYKVQMVWDLLIEHQNLGNTGAQAFYDSQAVLFEKWKDFLPVVRGVDMSEDEIDARTQLAISRQNYHYLDIKLHKSNEYRLGNVILHPILFLKRKLGIR